MKLKNKWNGLLDWCVVHLRATPSMQGLPYWIAAFVTALVAVGYAFSHLQTHHFLEQLVRDHPQWLYVLSPACFLASWLVVHHMARGAAGSGIPQVLAVFECSEISKRKKSVRALLGFRVWVAKILSSLLAVLGGGALGIEGPTIQLGAGIFFSIGKRFQKIWAHLRPEYFLVAGAGAGIAAAFNTPLGGIVYSIEEFSSAQLSRFKTFLITGVIISGLTAQTILGTYLYLGVPKVAVFDKSILPWVIGLAILGGLWGGLFGRLIHSISVWRAENLKNTWQKGLLAISMGLTVAVLIIHVDSRTLGAGRNVVVDLLQKTSTEQDLSLLLTRFLSPILAYVSGAAGGIFAPSLAAGGTFGHYFAGIFKPEHSNLFVLIGMIAFLTGVTRLLFTSFVLVLEMTDRHSALFPMMIAAVIANASSKLIDSKTVYEHMVPLFKKHLYKDEELEEMAAAELAIKEKIVP